MVFDMHLPVCAPADPDQSKSGGRSSANPTHRPFHAKAGHQPKSKSGKEAETKKPDDQASRKKPPMAPYEIAIRENFGAPASAPSSYALMTATSDLEPEIQRINELIKDSKLNSGNAREIFRDLAIKLDLLRKASITWKENSQSLIDEINRCILSKSTTVLARNKFQSLCLDVSKRLSEFYSELKFFIRNIEKRSSKDNKYNFKIYCTKNNPDPKDQPSGFDFIYFVDEHLSEAISNIQYATTFQLGVLHCYLEEISLSKTNIILNHDFSDDEQKYRLLTDIEASKLKYVED